MSRCFSDSGAFRDSLKGGLILYIFSNYEPRADTLRFCSEVVDNHHHSTVKVDLNFGVTAQRQSLMNHGSLGWRFWH